MKNEKLETFDLFGQFRDELQDVGFDAHIGHLEDGGLGILVDRHEERIALDAAHMLECAADAEGQINLGFDGQAGGAHLAGFFQPFGIHDGP
jgi:hypothetical protein